MPVSEAQVEVRLFARLAEVFGQKRVSIRLVEGLDVGGVMSILCDQPYKTRALLTEDRTVRTELTVLVNGRNIAFLSGLDTPLASGDVVSLFPVLVGG